MLMPIAAAAAGGASLLGGSSPPTLTSVAISPTWVRASETMTATPSATGATSYTYVWTNDGTPIVGATSSTYANDGSFGSNAINCTVTAHNSSGSSSPVEAVSDATIAWVGYVAASGTSSTSAQNIDCGTPMLGQSVWMASTWATPSGNITIEASGPSSLTGHAYYKGNTGAVANRTTYLYALTTSDQTITYQKVSGNYSLQLFFKTVGFSTTPAGLVAAGQASSNTTGSTPTISIIADDALFAGCEQYETVADPGGIDFLSRSVFQQFTTNNYTTGGGGISTGTNATLGVAFSIDTATANKHAFIWKAARA
jgi:hypothetical protein